MKRILAFFLFLPLVLVSCTTSSAQVLKYDISSGIQNLDPQFATEQNALMVIANTFEGLYRQLPSGETVPGIAKGYTVSDDGLTYTFSLRKDAKWNRSPNATGSWTSQQESWVSPEGTPVTAQDFVFALRRLFDPQAPSPHAESFTCIRYAREVLSGALPVTSLGVRALDDYTLEIRLARPESRLLELLASTPAMPCNQAFFESTRARYGLELDCLLFCGPFYLRSWENDSVLSLRPNPTYYDAASISSGGVNLAVLDGESDSLSRFLNGSTDFCKISSDSLSQVEEMGATIYQYEDTVWVLAINPQKLGVSGTDFTRAIAHTVDRRRFEGNLPENLRTTSVLIPPAVSPESHNYRDYAGELSPIVYSPDLARQYYQDGLEEHQISKLPLTELLICDDGQYPLLAGYVQQGLQQELSIYTSFEKVSREELLKKVFAGDYQAAILPLSASYASPESLFSYFRSNAAQNFTGYQSEIFDSLLESAGSASGDTLYDIYKQTEQRLLQDAYVVPLFFETTYYASSPGISGVAFSPFPSGISFRDAVKN